VGLSRKADMHGTGEYHCICNIIGALFMQHWGSSFVIRTRLFVENIAPSVPVCRVDEEIRELDTEPEAAEEPKREEA
jgi:hypothetical protein